jgi:hemoglobin
MNQSPANPTPTYGQGDTSFQTAGGQSGIRKLVDDFYDVMATRGRAHKIRDMHPLDLEESRDKLTLFLCGWLGGPKLFRDKYGPISIPQAHRHLVIGPEERDAWLFCMAEALKLQPYPDDFNEYLLRQLAIPAERCRTTD